MFKKPVSGTKSFQLRFSRRLDLDFEIDKGIANNMHVQVSPSFYIINPSDKSVYPVGAGLISVSELESNINTQLGEDRE